MTDTTSPDRTALAVFVGIIMVVPGMVLAAIFVTIYSFILKGIIGMGSSWIPYLNEIGLVWFPELLRGLIAGVVAIATVEKLFARFNGDTVRYAIVCFWGAIVLAIIAFAVSAVGFNMNTIGSVALLVGLGVSVFALRST